MNFARVDEIMRQAVLNHAFPAAALLVGQREKVLFRRAYGRLGYGEQEPATTEQTRFDIASLTKPLTAEIVLRMVSQRRLSLDEAMDAYWREPDLAQDPRRHLLTARLALSHRTGLPNWRADSGLVASGRAPP